MDKIKIQKLIKFYGLEEGKKYYVGELVNIRLDKLSCYLHTKETYRCTTACLKNDGNGYYYLELDNNMKILLFDLEKGYNKSIFNVPSIIARFPDGGYVSSYVPNKIIPYGWLTDKGYDGIRFIISTLYPYIGNEPRQMNIFDDLGVKYEN